MYSRVFMFLILSRMAALATVMCTVKAVQNITKILTNISLSSTYANKTALICALPRICLKKVTAGIHTSTRQNSLLEFFDDEQNWGEPRIKVGRSWRKEELRLKSNEDLHKLWYVLLKEKNMLLTMEHACKTKYEYFPNPERIDKVEESMENLETVVRERNRAYHELETGEHGERPIKYVRSQIGLPFRHRMREYFIPKHMNKKWQSSNIHSFGGYAVSKFLRLYREKLFLQNRRRRNRERNHLMGLLRRFPNMDMESLKAKFPNHDIEKIKEYKFSRGHYLPE